MVYTAAYWINHLNLSQHIEGGAYRRVYESDLLLRKENLPQDFHGDRPVCTSIYFLLEAGQISRMHKIASDEIWHFYFGDPLLIYEIDKKGVLNIHTLGQQPDKGQQLQVKVAAGSWFGSLPANGGSYSLCGCTVAPGFHFDDFEMADKADMIARFPGHRDVIELLCAC